MIFRPELAAKVLDQTKTVTRRRLTHTNGRQIAYQVGRTYAVQEGRGKKHIGHIYIRSIDTMPLGWIDTINGDAQKEGFENAAEFKDYWTKLHGEYHAQEIVARIAFELTQPCAECWDADRDYDLAEPSHAE